MRDAQTFIQDYLAHEYDPVKAREYYLRTRKLKGRKKGSGVEKAGGPSTGRPVATKAPPPKATAAAKPASKGARLKVLNERLTRLKEVLDLLDQKVAAAQARSGVEGVAKKTAASKSTDSKDKSADKKTASEKKEDAKKAAERYEKNKNPETAKGAQAVQDEIEAVQKKIADARADLAKALAAASKKRAASPKPTTASGRPTKSKEGVRQNGA